MFSGKCEVCMQSVSPAVFNGSYVKFTCPSLTVKKKEIKAKEVAANKINKRKLCNAFLLEGIST